MKPTMLVPLALILLAASSAEVFSVAASSAEAAEVREEMFPKRELQFEVAENHPPVKRTLKVPDMVKYRYVASFALTFEFPPIELGLMRNPRRLMIIHGNRLSDLVDTVPEDRLPAKDLLQALTEDALAMYGEGMVTRSGRASRGMPDDEDTQHSFRYVYQILGTTAEQAQDLSRALVLLVDHGHSRGLHQSLVGEVASHREAMALQEADLKKNRPVLSEHFKELQQLEEYKDVGAKELADFRTQQRLISVDLAGIQARIKACERLLSDPDKFVPHQEQIETVKITAEIDLVGLEARRRALEGITEKAAQYLRLSAEAAKLGDGIERAERAVSIYQRDLERFAAAIEQKMAFAKVSPITIHRVEWKLSDK